jgi:hypothetical protein
MKKYCVDTSGLSTPLEYMPEDIYASLWERIRELITTGCMAVTREIYDEMTHITGMMGDCISNNRGLLLLEVGSGEWDWQSYLTCFKGMETTHHLYISEYNRNRKNTVGLADLSIIALGKSMSLPVVSMETPVRDQSATRRKIPDICWMESILHLDFNAFLRQEGIKL